MLRLVSIGWVFVASLAAQGADVIGRSCGVSSLDGELCAGGPRYSARFHADGARFVPLLGAAAGAHALRYTFVEARRGDARIAAFAPVEPALAAERVCYARGDVIERYEARIDGVEQSFVFERCPAGSGDLIVRGRIESDLPLAVAEDGAVRFAQPEVGGVEFGAVTGVAADGATARGSLRVCGDEIEFVLPESFVASAAYPLVLDPLIGAVITVGDDAAHDDVAPDVAFDEGTGRYLVVWSTPTPTVSTEIRAQVVTSAGVVLGNQILIATGELVDAVPAVASVRQSGRFVVVWRGSNGVLLRAVSATTGALSSAVTVAASSLAVSFDAKVGVGGDSTSGLLGSSVALVVFSGSSLFSPSFGTAIVVQVPISGTPVVGSPTSLSGPLSTVAYGEVAVSRHAGGFAGRWFVTFSFNPTAMQPPYTNVAVVAIDRSGARCGQQTLINNASGDLRSLCVATPNGGEGVAGWADAASGRVQIRRFVASGTCGSLSFALDPLVTPAGTSVNSRSPAIAYVKDKYVLAWDPTSLLAGRSLVAKGIDPVTCVTCGNQITVDRPTVDATPAVVSAWEGGDTSSDAALITWSINSSIQARRWASHGAPIAVNMGGGCGVSALSDVATFSGTPAIGDRTFAFSLFNPTAPVLGLVLGFGQGNFACGSCTLVPTADAVLPGVTPSPLAVPCIASLIGTDLYSQWIQARPSNCGLFSSLSLSDCLRVTIVE